jgi:hypothetical protein
MEFVRQLSTGAVGTDAGRRAVHQQRGVCIGAAAANRLFYSLIRVVSICMAGSHSHCWLLISRVLPSRPLCVSGTSINKQRVNPGNCPVQTLMWGAIVSGVQTLCSPAQLWKLRGGVFLEREVQKEEEESQEKTEQTKSKLRVP